MVKIPPGPPPASIVTLKAEGLPGKGENIADLPQGRVVQATVVESTADKLVFDVGPRRFAAAAGLPVQVGQKLNVLVVTTSPTPVFQVWHDSLQNRIINTLHLLADRWDNLQAGAPAKGEGDGLPLLSPKGRQALENWQTYVRDPLATPFKGEELRQLSRYLGLTLERDLAVGRKAEPALKNALLEAVGRLAGQERETGRQVLLQLAERLGEGSRIFQALPPAAREVVRAFFAARPEPALPKGADSGALPDQKGADSGRFQEGAAIQRSGARDNGAGWAARGRVAAGDFLKLDDLRSLARNLGLELNFTKAGKGLGTVLESGTAIRGIGVEFSGAGRGREVAIVAEFRQALAEIAVRLQAAEQEPARQLGQQISRLLEAGSGAALRYVPESVPQLENWLGLAKNPPAAPLPDNELKFLAQLLGLDAGRKTAEAAKPATPQGAADKLLALATQLQATKEGMAPEMGNLLQRLVAEGGPFLKELPPETRQALHNVLTFLYEPATPPLKSEELLLLALLFKFQPHLGPPAREPAGQELKDVLQEAAARLQDDKGGLLKNISRQLQQLELFQFTQIKLDQQNLYFMPLPLPFLEQGYLLAEYPGAGDEQEEGRSQMLSLYLSLQGLGDLQVDLLQGEEGIYLRFLFDSQEKAEFAAGFQGELEKALASFSLKSVTFATGAERPAAGLIKRLVSEGEGGLDMQV